jgi:acetolactate synthase regulatory subunit
MLERVMGDSKRLGSQVKALNSTVHLFGHSHINCQRVVDGTRYVQAALGYEREQCFGIFSTEPFKLAST